MRHFSCFFKDPISSPNLTPRTYHEINWEVNTNTDTSIGPRCGALSINVDYEVCMKTTLPQMKIGLMEFKRITKDPLINALHLLINTLKSLIKPLYPF